MFWNALPADIRHIRHLYF